MSVSLFYVRVPRLSSDPQSVRHRAELLYGEGVVQHGGGAPQGRSEKLDGGVRVMRIANSFEAAAEMLQQEFWDHNGDRFTLGLVKRSPIVGLPAERPSGVLDAPVPHPGRLWQFARTDKLSLVQRIAQAKPEAQTERGFVDAVLATLAGCTGCELRGNHIQWLGDVVLVNPVGTPAAWRPIRSASDSSCRSFDVVVEDGFRESVHVQVRVTGLDGMCICDRLLEWHVGDDLSRRVDLAEELGAVFMRAWVDSDLILEESSALCRGFNTTVSLAAGSFSIHDRLTQKLEKAVRGGSATAETLESARRSERSESTARTATTMSQEPWSGLNGTADTLLDVVRPPVEHYSHFPKGSEGRATAMLRFAELIRGAAEAYLVDPWFDALGAESLLLRIQGDVHLTVVTNLPCSPNDDDPRTQLKRFLTTTSHYLLPRNLKVICVVGGRPEKQVFHDRFLLLRKANHWRGYVLTNSFSGMATEYSLFVVEAPFGMVGLLLDELERLLDSPTGTAVSLWPPEAQPRQSGLDRGEFPGWRPLLRGLVPWLASPSRQWLLSAQARGFIQVSRDGMRWRMTPPAREKCLRWMLNPHALSGCEKRRRGFVLGRSTNSSFRSLRRGFDIGTAALALGEMSARGFEVDAFAIGARLKNGHGYSIEVALRRSFREDQDPTRIHPGDSLERVNLRQSLGCEVAFPRAAQLALTFVTNKVWALGKPTHWDRCFGYGVLLYLEPERAVRLCEQLHDADLILAFVDSLRPTINEWAEDIPVALVKSISPTLRALGAVFLVNQSFDCDDSNSLSASGALALGVNRLRETGVSSEEIGHFLVALGISQWTLLGSVVSNELVQHLGTLGSQHLEVVVAHVYENENLAADLVENLVRNLCRRQDSWVINVLGSMVRRFSQRFRSPLHQLRFSRVTDLRFTEVHGQALLDLSLRQGSSPGALLRTFVDVGGLYRHARRLSPFRQRPNAGSSEVALGWLALWELLAERQTDGDGVHRAPVDVVRRTRQLLDDQTHFESRDIRACLRQLLDETRELPPLPPPPEC